VALLVWLGGEGIESSPAEKDLGILTKEKLDISWECVLGAQKAIFFPERYSKNLGQQVEGGDSAPLLDSAKIPPGVLHPGLES